jgi:hypothetical protein
MDVEDGGGLIIKTTNEGDNIWIASSDSKLPRQEKGRDKKTAMI